MPATTTPIYFSRENSTYGSGSLLRGSTAGVVNGTVASGVPASTFGSPEYSTSIPSRGGTPTVTGSGNRPTPNGTGWFLEDSTLDGRRTTNDAASTLGITFENFSGLVDAYLYAHFYTYDTVAGTYTYFAQMVDTSTTWRNTKTAVLSGSLPISGQFSATRKLYVELLWYFWDGGSTARTVTLRTGETTVAASLQLRTIPNSDVAPPNDALVDARPIGTTFTGTTLQFNTYASYESGETVNGPIYNKVYGGGEAADGPGSLWYKWTCPSDGSAPEYFTVDTTGTRNTSTTDGDSSSPYYGQYVSIDTRLRCYTSSTPSAPTYASLTLFDESDDIGSAYPFGGPGVWSEIRIDQPTPGQTYFFQLMTQTRGASSSQEMPGESWYSLVYGNLRLNWKQLWRGPWISRPEVTYTRANLDALNNSTNLANGKYFQQSQVVHGGWSFWQFAPYPNPCVYPEAYDIASFICHIGDQSIDELENNRDATWALDAQYPYSPYWVPGAFRTGGRINPFDMNARSQTTSLPWGTGGGTGPGSSGGSHSVYPTFPGMLETRSVWSVETFSPKAAAFTADNWTYLGKLPGSTDLTGLPAGTYGITYSKENCDVVSFKVRPNTGGTSQHPHGLPTMSARWYWQYNDYPLVPPYNQQGDQLGWGWWWRDNAYGQKVLACRTDCTPHEFPRVLPGDLQNQYQTQLVGEVTYTNGSLVSRTMTWTQVESYQTYNRATDPLPDWGDYYLFPFIADYIEANQSLGNQISTAQQGTSTWSFARKIDGQSLEFELVLQPPCYALLYDSPQYPTNTCPGMGQPPPPPPDPTVVPDITGAYNQERIRFWRNDPRSS